MKPVVLALAAIMVAMPARADELLEPDAAGPPPAALARAFAPDVVLRAVVIPSFQQVFAVGLAKRPDGALVLFSVADAVIPRRPAPASTAPLLCEMPVPPHTAHDLVALWTAMLVTTAPPPPNMIRADGNTTHVAVLSGGAWRIGKTWSPRIDTRPGALVGIVYGLRAACDDPARLTEVQTDTTRLLKRLNMEP